ncbi:MAG: hypothetical protein AAFU41_08345 [Pseudomonadota bacterium]
MTELNFAYAPREWAKPLHARLGQPSTRAIVAILHRRAGKSYFGAASIILGALSRAGSYGIIGPHRATMKAIFWPLLREMLQGIPNVDIRVGDLTVTVPVLDGSGRTSTISIHSAGDDNQGSNIRGLKFHGIFVDEVGNIGSDALWGEIWPTQSGLENPWAIFAGTPRGYDALADLFRSCDARPGWSGIQLGVYDTNIFSAEEIETTREAMPREQFEREMLVRLDVGTSNQLIKIEHVQACMARSLSQADHLDLKASQPLVCGVDVGRLNDASVIVLRRGHAVIDIVRVPSPCETQELAFRVLNICRQNDVDLLTVDAGAMGIAVCDVMRQIGLFPVPVNFGSRPDDPERYANKRAEVYDRMRAWTEKASSILPKDLRLQKELSATRFKLSSTNKLQLESKADIKSRLGTSPDAADAIALTFAVSESVAPSLAQRALDVLRDRDFTRGADGSRYSSVNKFPNREIDPYDDTHREVFDPFDDSGPTYHGYDTATPIPNW